MGIFGNSPAAESTMSKKTKKNAKASDDGSTSSAQDTTEWIWKMLGLGKIDISYACIGYAFNGSMVLDHDDLVELFLAYGFSIETAMAFVDDFAEQSSKDSNAPIVMFRKNIADIRSIVEPIIDGTET